MAAIMQSGNLYVYCAGNPVMFVDPGGEFILAAIIVGAIIGAVAGGIYGNHKANQAGYTINDGWEYLKYVVGYGAGGAVAGALIGWGVGAAAQAIGAAITAGSGGVLGTTIYQTWQQAEQSLRNLIGSVGAYADRVLWTPFGNRIVDAYNVGKGFIAEAKYGYASLWYTA